MDKLTNLPNSATSPGQFQRPNFHTVTHGRVPAPNGVSLIDKELVAFSSDKVVSMKVIFNAVNQRLVSHQGFEKTFKESSASIKSTFDSDEVTETVFGFIKDSIMRAKENGKSDSELKEMFEQAKEGIAIGFGQALEELSELNKLTDDIRQGVAKSHEDINQHIDELYQSFFPEEITPQESTNSSVLPEYDNGLQPLNGGQVEAVASQFNGNYSHSDARNSDLTITTNDGDEIRISFYSNEYSNASIGYSSGPESGNEHFMISAGYGIESGFSIAIEGELDEGEREAISSLLKDIDKIQESFYSGNIGEAFEYAMNLGFDTSELSSLSLDLQQTQTFRAREVYQEVAAIGHESPIEDKSLRPILDFITELRALRWQSSEIANIEQSQFAEIFKQLSITKFNEQPEKAVELNKLVEDIEASGD